MALMVVITSGIAMAETRIEANYDLYETGDEDGYKTGEMNLWDTVVYHLTSNRAGGSLTTVGGALCSRTADISEDYTWSSCDPGQAATYYHTNNDHIGLVFQMFRVNDDGSWTLVNEERLERDETGGTQIECGQQYHIKVFYCDDTSDERTCEDNSDRYTAGSVTFTSSTGNEEIYYDRCDGPNTLLERGCDSDDSPVTKTIECECRDYACVEEEDPPEQCDPRTISGKYCAGDEVVQDYIYSDCTESTQTVTICGNTEECDNGQCVDATNIITCYQCQDGEVTQKDFEDVCGTDWQRTQPECTSTVTCYRCDDGETVAQNFTDVCDEGWTRSEPECINKTLCYQCQDGEVVSEIFDNGCAEGWTTESPGSCEENGQEPGTPDTQPNLWERIVTFFAQIFGGA